MNKVEQIISEQIFNQNSIFVFPSQIATTRWAERATKITKAKAVALERFIAWDDFKSESIRSKQQNKKAIPSTLRKIFAIQLINENSEKKLLKYFIQQEYAQNAQNFSTWISSIISVWVSQSGFILLGCVSTWWSLPTPTYR